MTEYHLSEFEHKWLDEAKVSLTYKATSKDEHKVWEREARLKLRELYKITTNFSEKPEILWGQESIRNNIKVIFFKHRAYDGELRDHILLKSPDPKGVVIALNDEVQLEDIAALSDPEKSGRSDRAIGMLLAKAGIAVIVSELRGFGRTEHPKKYGYGGIYVTTSAYTALGKDPLAVVYARDNIQTVAVAKKLFPKAKIGFVGISKAGWNTALTTALTKDIDFAYVASGISHEHRTGFTTATHRYPFGFLNFFYSADILCLIAPRPLRLSYGLKENINYSREAEKRETIAYGMRSYNNLDAEKNISQLTHPEGHIFIKEDVVSFFSRNIR